MIVEQQKEILTLTQHDKFAVCHMVKNMRISRVEKKREDKNVICCYEKFKNFFFYSLINEVKS